MKIRRYLANNTQEAMLKVKMDLGIEAVILNTRKVRQRGLFKLFAKPMVEVLAAVDDVIDSKDRGTKGQKSSKDINKEEKYEKDAGIKLEKVAELETKVANMEDVLNRIYSKLQQGNPQQSEQQSVQEQQVSTSAVSAAAEEDVIVKTLEGKLIENEISQQTVKAVITSVKNKTGARATINEIVTASYNTIGDILGKSSPITLRANIKPTVAIFVGPTGVGKTTTLAKIAANFALNNKKQVGLITADTYRIAAVDQLKTYAEILGIPLSVVYSPAEIKNAIADFSDKDLVLIDTAGRSHNNLPQFEELKSLVRASGADEIFLVISATTGIGYIQKIFEHYSFLGNYKLIFTKLDESPSYGIILDAKNLSGRNLSYLTIGQSVPDDIEVVNIDRITRNIMEDIVRSIK